MKGFLDCHQQQGEKVLADPEDVAGPEVWARLTDAERKARTKEFNDSKLAITTAATNRKKEDAQKFHPLKSHFPIEDQNTDKKFWKQRVNCEYNQFLLDITQRDANEVVKKRLVLAQVTETQRLNIFKAVRWSLIPHEQLMETSLNPAFDTARPLILEALSLRLVNYEHS